PIDLGIRGTITSWGRRHRTTYFGEFVIFRARSWSSLIPTIERSIRFGSYGPTGVRVLLYERCLGAWRRIHLAMRALGVAGPRLRVRKDTAIRTVKCWMRPSCAGSIRWWSA